MSGFVKNFRELDVYKNAMSLTMEIFSLIPKFPSDEKFELSDQLKRSSRSVCRNLGEAWRKRRYRAAFIAKLSDCEAEACETQVSLEIAYNCSYIDKRTFNRMDESYEKLISQIVTMINNADQWLIKTPK